MSLAARRTADAVAIAASTTGVSADVSSCTLGTVGVLSDELDAFAACGGDRPQHAKFGATVRVRQLILDG
jgi:hypothetical protein